MHTAIASLGTAGVISRGFRICPIVAAMLFVVFPSNPIAETDPVPACQDGLDNDGDSLVDFPADPGCSSPEDPDESGPFFQVDVRTDKTEYEPGEFVLIDVFVTNVGSETVTMQFNTGCQSFFTVEDSTGATVFDSRGPCVAVVTFLILDPGRTELYEFDWNQRDNVLNLVWVPDLFTIRGFIGFPDPLAGGSTGIVISAECADLVDNDGDGLRDYPEDPGCAARLDTREQDPPVLNLEGDLLSWEGIEAAKYDVVWGDLMALRRDTGDFRTAVLECLEDNFPRTSVEIPEPPSTGGAHWFLVRDVRGGVHGTYNSGSRFQVASRDPGINASPLSCP